MLNTGFCKLSLRVHGFQAQAFYKGQDLGDMVQGLGICLGLMMMVLSNKYFKVEQANDSLSRVAIRCDTCTLCFAGHAVAP